MNCIFAVTSKDFFFWSGSFGAPHRVLVVAGANKVAGTCRLKQDPDFADASNINFIRLTDYLAGIELAMQLQYWSDTAPLIEFVNEQGMMAKEDMLSKKCILFARYISFKY